MRSPKLTPPPKKNAAAEHPADAALLPLLPQQGGDGGDDPRGIAHARVLRRLAPARRMRWWRSGHVLSQQAGALPQTAGPHAVTGHATENITKEVRFRETLLFRLSCTTCWTGRSS